MERSIQGTKGDTGTDRETRVHYQDEENSEEWQMQTKVWVEDSGTQKSTGYKRLEWKDIQLVN